MTRYAFPMVGHEGADRPEVETGSKGILSVMEESTSDTLAEVKILLHIYY